MGATLSLRKTDILTHVSATARGEDVLYRAATPKGTGSSSNPHRAPAIATSSSLRQPRKDPLPSPSTEPERPQPRQDERSDALPGTYPLQQYKPPAERTVYVRPVRTAFSSPPCLGAGASCV